MISKKKKKKKDFRDVSIYRLLFLQLICAVNKTFLNTQATLSQIARFYS